MLLKLILNYRNKCNIKLKVLSSFLYSNFTCSICSFLPVLPLHGSISHKPASLKTKVNGLSSFLSPLVSQGELPQTQLFISAPPGSVEGVLCCELLGLSCCLCSHRSQTCQTVMQVYLLWIRSRTETSHLSSIHHTDRQSDVC